MTESYDLQAAAKAEQENPTQGSPTIQVSKLVVFTTIGFIVVSRLYSGRLVTDTSVLRDRETPHTIFLV